MVEIKVLGQVQGFRDGQPVDLGGPTQRRLLAALVARPGETVPVTTLLEDLWGDDPPPSGPQSIQSYVSRLRRNLGSDTIETRSPGYHLNTEGLQVDSFEFLDMASSLPDDPGDRLEAIEDALGLWSGPPFEDFTHVEFAARRLIETRHDLEEKRARILAGLGRSGEAIAALEKITTTAPLRESAWLTLSRVLVGAGRQAEAVRTLDGYRESLAEVGLEPGPEFDATQDEVFETPTTETVASPLPRVQTKFVGRAEELAKLRDLLATNQLVTVTGPGGMGKTRLVVEAAGDWQPTPVIFATLASLRDEREVAPTVLRAIGGETRGDPVDSTVTRLAREPTVLIIDNAEHVIETVADLVSEIVSQTETVAVVTSREPLNVPSEVVLSLDSLEPADAIDLYRDRAGRVDPNFEAGNSVLDMLCEELDYMPLAIEMAASRSKALSPNQILTLITRDYGLFDKPRRGTAQRHRSLDALVDWSYGLLENRGRRVFERLSVIAGTFDVDLATAVAGFGDVSPIHVAAVTADLVDRSLVLRTATGRFRMLRVLRSFAEHKLTESEDETETRHLHSRWFADLASAIGEGLWTLEETLWIETANNSIDDMGAALSWAVQANDPDTAQKILEGLFDWFYHRQPPAITHWGEMARPIAKGHDLHSVASAWTSLAAMKRGDIETANSVAVEGTQVSGPAGRFAWFMAGELACYQGRLEDALDAYRKQLLRAHDQHDRIGVFDATAGETVALAYKGMFDRAQDVAVNLENMISDLGAPTYRAYAQYSVGETLIQTDPHQAARLLVAAADLAASVNNQYTEALARTTLGSVLARLGRVDEAIENLHRAIVLWDPLGMPAYHWAAIQNLGATLADLGQTETALKLLSAAENGGRPPFGVRHSHWVDIVEKLRAEEGYEDWAKAGAAMDLEQASRLALAATRAGAP